MDSVQYDIWGEPAMQPCGPTRVAAARGNRQSPTGTPYACTRTYTRREPAMQPKGSIPQPCGPHRTAGWIPQCLLQSAWPRLGSPRAGRLALSSASIHPWPPPCSGSARRRRQRSASAARQRGIYGAATLWTFLEIIIRRRDETRPVVSHDATHYLSTHLVRSWRVRVALQRSTVTLQGHRDGPVVRALCTGRQGKHY